MLLRNAGERVIDRVDAQLGELAIGLDGRLGLDHVPPVGQAGIVDLQHESGRDHRAVFLAHGLGQREQEFLVGLVVFVEDEVVEPARRQHRDERLLDLGARARDRGLEGVDLAVDRFRSLRFDRAAGDDAFGHRRHRLLAGHEEQRPELVHVGIELAEFVALARRVPRGRRLARLAPGAPRCR